MPKAMLKALLKKELIEFNSFYFTNKKTGKRRSTAGTVGFILLFVFLYLVLAFSFGGIAAFFGHSFIPLGFDWLYFSLLGMVSLFLSSFVNMFTASTLLFRAKDNELLLSMPIPPSGILFSRMTGLYGSGLLFEAITFLPALVLYWFFLATTEGRALSASAVVLPLCVFLLSSVLILALSTLFGWIVAAISSKLKSKSIISVLITLVLLGLYYVIYFRLNSLMESAAENAEQLGEAIRKYIFPVYHLGRAGAGDLLSLLIYAVFCVGLFAVLCFAVAKSFTRITTTDGTSTAGKTDPNAVKAQVRQLPFRTSLVRRELRHFVNSAPYMMNVGLGLIILPVLGVAAAIKADTLRPLIEAFTIADSRIGDFLPVAAAAIGALVLSMCCFTAPSVSLEGKNIWIAQTMPIEPYEFLLAKQKAHLALAAIPAVIYTVIVGVVIGAEVPSIVFMLLFLFAFLLLSSSAGLWANLRHPDLTWKNETVPIKQGMSIVITMFGGWAAALIVGVGGFLLSGTIDMDLYLVGVSLIFALLSRVLTRWLKGSGSEIFASLQS